jgi:hypothetical protein
MFPASFSMANMSPPAANMYPTALVIDIQELTLEFHFKCYIMMLKLVLAVEYIV